LTRGISSARGNRASRSALLNRRRELSRRKNTMKVKTRHRLIVRVSGITFMGFTRVPGWDAVVLAAPLSAGLNAHIHAWEGESAHVTRRANSPRRRKAERKRV